MNKICFILVVVVFSFIFCCTHKDRYSTYQEEIKEAVAQMDGKKLFFPDSLFFYSEDGLVEASSFMRSMNKRKIVTVVAGNCGKCVMNIKKWVPFYQSMKDNGYNNNLIIIIEDVNPKYFKEFYSEETPSELTLIFDKRCTFSTINNLPKNKLLQTFLVDINDKVLLTGNPLFDKRLWSLYLDELVKNQ